MNPRKRSTTRASSSPDTFKFFIDDLIKSLNLSKANDLTSAFADDLLTLGEYIESLIETIQLYEDWAMNNKMEISKSKSNIMFL